MKRSAVKELLNNTSHAPLMDGVTLTDASLWPKFAVKGPGAAAWPRGRGVTVPGGVYDTARPSVSDLVVRTGGDEFVVQTTEETGLATRLAAACESGGGVWPFPHEAATFILAGQRATDVWAQTCGVNFEEQPQDRVLYTRVAGVSCAILPESRDGAVAYRLWVPVSFAVYLWETLTQIIGEL